MKRIFVVGCPRSGTTLIQTLLAARGDVYTCKETHYFQRIRRSGKAKVLDYLRLSSKNVSNAYDFIRTHNELLGRHDPDGIRSVRSATLFFDQVMTREAQARGKSAWVEKTPGHLFYVPWIERHIPQVQFVHVFRDGRDVVASLVDAAQRFPEARAWKSMTDVGVAIDTYNRCLRESLKYNGRKCHFFLQYERVLDDVDGACADLFAQLGWENTETSLGLESVHKEIVRGDEGWKNGFGGEIKDTRLVKFNQVFDEEQRKLVIRGVQEVPLA